MSKVKSWEVTDAFWERVDSLIPLHSGHQAGLTAARRAAGASPNLPAWCLRASCTY